jgi:outer membrane receptor protein involved in Fe transport
MPDFFFVPPTATNISSGFERLSLYGYGHWQPVEQMLFIAGLSYDRVKYPENFRAPPLFHAQARTERVSPKAGVILTPWTGGTIRAAYTRSLGGVSLDQSFQLEPSQIAGFSQTFRSLIPESVAGALAGQRNETFGAALDQKFPTRTYFGVSAELLRARSTQTIGAYDFVFPAEATLASTRQSLNFQEQSLHATLNQLVGTEWSFGAHYRLAHARLASTFPDLLPTVPVTGGFVQFQDQKATLQQLDLFALYTHPCGFFGQADGIWSGQNNSGYSPSEPGDHFWQCNAFIGYRFPHRRVEVRAGVLNINDRDYRLNPLTLYSELPRRRAAMVSLKFYF